MDEAAGTGVRRERERETVSTAGQPVKAVSDNGQISTMLGNANKSWW